MKNNIHEKALRVTNQYKTSFIGQLQNCKSDRSLVKWHKNLQQLLIEIQCVSVGLFFSIMKTIVKLE